MASIYMYHAVGEGCDIDGADPHYAVSTEVLCDQLAAITTGEPVAEQLRTAGNVEAHSIGFDDGHVSNYKNAFSALLECGVRAEFYINTIMVGEKHFMTWPQIQELADAGMSIQSHGHEHRYFSDMNQAEIDKQLSCSKSLIEDKIGREVTIFAPPGGRYDHRVTASAKSLGYKAMAISRPGTISGQSDFHLPRFAVLASTSNREILQWKSSFSSSTIKQAIKYRGTGFVKSCLGNQRYELLRQRLLGEPGAMEQN